jgi:type VI secretion system protein ImpA
VRAQSNLNEIEIYTPLRKRLGAGLGLLEAITSDSPCGEDLEDTQLLASFDAYRLFGQAAPLSADIDWPQIRDRAHEALASSKDFRLLTHLGCALIRTGGLGEYVTVLGVASKWLETWWTDVYPRVDDDAILRKNALNGFADRMAIVDGLRRVPVLRHRQLGSYSIRDIEIATGHLNPAEGEPQTLDAAQLSALLTDSALEDLEALRTQLQDSLASLKAIESIMREQGGVEAVPDFSILATPLARTANFIAAHIATRAPAQSAVAAGSADQDSGVGAGGAAATIGVGAIRTRSDATRALDAVAEFFRANEPSSPIPLLLERAKRLVAKDFLAVLAELAPDALMQAKAASGVRDEE